MAQLPPDGEWLVQLVGNDVIVLHRYSEEEIVHYDNTDADATAKAQYLLHLDDRLTTEQKTFAHFWCGYFHAFGGK